MNALCTASSRPVRDPTTRGESCGFVDESFGPARALWAVWTANAHALSTALPTLSRLSPTSSTGPTTGDSQNKHRTTLRRGCLHRPFKTTSASHSNRSQHRPRAGSPPTLQAHFRMGLDWPCRRGSPRPLSRFAIVSANRVTCDIRLVTTGHFSIHTGQTIRSTSQTPSGRSFGRLAVLRALNSPPAPMPSTF